MNKEDFKKKVENIITINSEINFSQISIEEILEIFLDKNITASMCEKVKLLLKKMLVEKSTIEQQEKIAAKIEMLCNNH